MMKYSYKNLNVRRILELGDLDVRGIAERNEELTADKYFSYIVHFLESAHSHKELLTSVLELPENIRSLGEIEKKLGLPERSMKLSDDNKILNDLQSIKDELTQMGYDELNFYLDGICSATKDDNLQLTEKLAKEALDRFNILVERLSRAYTVKRFSNSQTDDKQENEPESEVLLTEALEALDYEEANRKLRILAVDDVTVVLNTLTSVLSPFYEVFALKSSTQVEKFLMHTTPELFLLDIEMKELNGFELVPLIRKFKEHKETPIIFITGNASLNNLKDASALGACDFIAKPVDRKVLLEKIQKNIVRRKAY